MTVVPCFGNPPEFLVYFSWGLPREINPTFAKKMDPAQTASTGKTAGKYKYEVTKAIAGSAGKTLLECIQEGIVEKPMAMSWNTWQQWRRTTSPKEETDGFRQDSTIERRLHLEVMEALFSCLSSEG